MSRPRVVLLRGHSANPWDLRPWEDLADRFEVSVLVTGSNAHDVEGLGLRRTAVRARRDAFPRGRLGDLATLAVGDGYRDLAAHLSGADVVHSAELGVWFSGQPARLKARLGFRLVLTVWETIPFRATYRAFRGRRDRRDALAAADLFLPATERARRCLLLEGAPAERIEVSPPGVDLSRFRPEAAAPAGGRHLLVSPGRLVWEKGHQDAIRALAALERGLVPGAEARARLLLVGAGPERARLERYAADLGVGGLVEVRAVPHAEMPALFAAASCVLLLSLPVPLWEEQFGMVLAEAMAAGAPVVAARSGAIPEVLAGGGTLVEPGDWHAVAQSLAAGPLARPSAERAAYDPAVVERYGSAAAAARLAAAYERVLASSSR